VTVFPREIAGALPYFEDKVAEREPAGQSPQGRAVCEATLERLVAGRYVEVWRKRLVNEVSPVSVAVSDRDGSFATFDNWHSMGHGDNAIVIYNTDGSVLKKLSLNAVFSKEEIQRMPRSVSSIEWRTGDIFVDESVPEVLVTVVKSERLDKTKKAYEQETQDIRISLRDGSVKK
jgi:hypothetical protein